MNDMSDASAVELSMIRQAVKNNIPINASLELLPLCNMNCDMCYIRLDTQEMKKKGRLRTCEEWLALAEELKEAGTLFLLLTGGEPLLYPDFRILYAKLKSLGMILTINTNGTLIDEKWADFFAEQKPRRVNLTLYGTDAETYEKLCHYRDGYEKALRAIALLKERNVPVKVGCSAVSKNRTDLQKIFALGDKLEMPVHVDSYMYPAVRERSESYDISTRLSPKDAANIWYQDLKRSMPVENFQAYRKQMLQYTEHRRNHPEEISKEQTGTQCMAGNCSLTVNWQGQMRPCVMLTSPTVPVFETGVKEGWEQLQKQSKKIPFPSKCQNCHLRPLCRICPASALYETGSYDTVPDYLCQYAETSYQYLKGEETDDNQTLPNC